MCIQLLTRWKTNQISTLFHNTLTSWIKLPSNCGLSHYSLRLGIIEKRHLYKNQNLKGWQIVINTRVGFKLQVTANLEDDSLWQWFYQTMLLLSAAPEGLDNNPSKHMNGAEALCSKV